jgi:hypothetical protein
MKSAFYVPYVPYVSAKEKFNSITNEMESLKPFLKIFKDIQGGCASEKRII